MVYDAFLFIFFALYYTQAYMHLLKRECDQKVVLKHYFHATRKEKVTKARRQYWCKALLLTVVKVIHVAPKWRLSWDILFFLLSTLVSFLFGLCFSTTKSNAPFWFFTCLLLFSHFYSFFSGNGENRRINSFALISRANLIN